MNHIKKTIKAIGEEPLEILKSAVKQISVEENIPATEQPKDEEQPKLDQTAMAQQDGRRLQALETELKDIRDQKRINELKKQEEADRTRNSQLVTNQLPELTLKRGRKMGGGQKGAAKREETRVEKPVPPSG